MKKLFKLLVVLLPITVNADYNYVDLGLPSGLLWATCNVGAESPEQYGNYYDWKSNPVQDYWDEVWRTPTKAERDELVNNCTYSLDTVNGVKGARYTASNGNSIFFPFAGYYQNGAGPYKVGEGGQYWTITPYNNEAYWIFATNSAVQADNNAYYWPLTYFSFPVRPVKEASKVSITISSSSGGKVYYNDTEISNTTTTMNLDAGSVVNLKIKANAGFEIGSILKKGVATQELLSEPQTEYTYTFNAAENISIDIKFVETVAVGTTFACDNIYYKTLSANEVEVTDNSVGYTGDIIIPESIIYNDRIYSVTAIGRNAFANTTARIRQNRDHKPTSITLPNSIKSISANAFSRCTSFSVIDIPNSVVSIGSGAFAYCSGLTTVTIGNSVDSIGSRTFGGCTALSSLSIGKSVAMIDNNAFENCTNITTLTINCDSIGSWFKGWWYVTELSLGDNVKTIGDDAFYGCYVQVILPNRLIYIGKRAFSHCSNTSIYIPKSVIFIGEENFMNCRSITVDNENPIYDSRDNCNAIIEKTTNTLVTGCSSSFIPESVTSIGKRAFVNCSGLISITIPNSVTKIGAEAFSSTLSSVILGENVVQMDSSFVNCWVLNKVYCFMEDAPSTIDHAFGTPQNATLYVPETSIDKYQGVSPWNQFREILPLPEKMTANLKGISYDIDTDNKTATVVAGYNSNYTGDIAIPSTINFYKSICDVTAIGDYAFDADPITSVSIPNSVKTIGDYAFSGTNLNTLYIPQSVMSIGVQAFRYCKLNTIVVDESNTVYDSREKCNAIIKTETNELLFGSASTVIPNTVTSIGDYAFSGRSELSSINFPNSITSIGESAFIGCNKLTSIEIPNSVNNIGDNPFAECSCLTSIIVDNNAFYDSRENCNAIINSSTNTLISGCSNTIIPNSITSIGIGAFSGCSNLKSVDIPQKVTTIGNGAFAGCASIEKLSIPNSVTSIGEWAFSSCSSLSSVTLSENLKTISGNLFMGSSSLTSIDIPNNVDSIGYGAFQTCKGLTTVIIGNKVKAIGQFAFAGSGVRDLTIGNNVKTIYSCAFVECFNLKQLVIPNSVSYLDGWSFAYCTNLRNVTLGEDIPSINGVFVYCDSILSITSLNPIPPSASWSLPNIDFSQATLSVPSGCKEAYQNASFWKNFTNIMEIDPSGIQSVTFNKDTNAPIYDLNGRKLKEPSKGINIIGRKKVVVK